MELVIYFMYSKGHFTGYRVKPGMTMLYKRGYG